MCVCFFARPFFFSRHSLMIAHHFLFYVTGMPEYVLHEYSPFRDSSDLGPADWATLARDIKANYLHFDGFVIITGTDTMAYCATVCICLLILF